MKPKPFTVSDHRLLFHHHINLSLPPNSSSPSSTPPPSPPSPPPTSPSPPLPTNPLSSDSELALQIQLCKPKVAFATSQTAHKLPSLPLGTVLIDSPEFNSLLTHSEPQTTHPQVEVSQSDVAAILYSSGTTGRVKGVALTHRNLIALISGFRHSKAVLDPNQPELPPVSLFILPLFHVFGFFMSINMFSRGGTLVLMERFEFVHMLKYVERYRITYMPVSPPLIVAFVKEDLTKKYDLSSLKTLGCGGAPLGKEVADAFKEKFPHVEIVQGYGLTETGGGATRTIGPEESSHLASVGRLSENMEAKIVDPETGEALGLGQRGELWLRGPTVMKGYVGDEKATAETLLPDGWLKTGDLCYFDSEGFLYIVDRLKELIKYKAYQVPPAELEKLLQSIPEIADAAVIPYPDEEAGQIPMAYVVRKPGSNTTEGQIMDSIAKQIQYAWIQTSATLKIIIKIIWLISLVGNMGLLSSLLFSLLIPTPPLIWLPDRSCTIQENKTSSFYQCHSKISSREDPEAGAGQSCSLWCFI
ncbi:4-COUMARATE--COA LIGASE-LIKE 9 [Salix viminalis]|uniref:4-COUMARATE--COA LIGASE-LIKE 9 n=1 Tax=Salix viminalis TaxID=40686 RepID=A0A9Q0SGH4_SALVM|nr:4-COUMARATE--COA LIGASE-LIKE 9 [Salix viminalis]